jgi:hypothetical protein
MENNITEKTSPGLEGAAPVVAPVATTAAPAAVPVAPVVPAPNTLVAKKQNNTTASAGKMSSFLQASRRSLNRGAFDATKLADIEGNLKNNYILSDAEKDTKAEHALHTMLTGGPIDMVPGAVSKVGLDTNQMRKNIMDKKFSLTADEQVKYGRAMQIFDTMVANNFSVMKGPGGVYWLESMENGKKVFASNGILEVAEMLDKFSGKADANGVLPDKHVETNPVKLAQRVIADPKYEAFTDSDKWMMLSLGTNIATTAIALGGKAVTVATGGAGIVAGAAGTAVGVVGGLAAVGMAMYSDYLNEDVSNREMWANAAIGAGLEAVETASIAPVSVIEGLKGASTAGKVLRKALHVWMLTGVLDTAIGNNWMDILNKDDKTLEDWKKLATMSQFVIGAAGGAALNRVGSRKILTKQIKTAGMELEEFDKGMRPTMAKPKANQVVIDEKVANVHALVAKKTAAKETQTATEVENLSSSFAKQKEIRGQKRQAEVNAAHAANHGSTVPALVIGESNPHLPALIPKPTRKTDLSKIDQKFAQEDAQAGLEYKAQKGALEESAAADIVKLQARGKSIADKVAPHQELMQERANTKANDKVIKEKYTEKNDADNARLEDMYNTMQVQHGSVIAKKLRAKAERKSGFTEEKIAADKEARNPAEAVVKKDTKLEAFAKEKAALDKKVEGLDPDKRAPEDIAELKRLKNAIKTEQKNSKGLRGAKNKLVARVKEGTSSSKKVMGTIARYAYAVPSAVAVRDGVSSKALSKAYMTSDQMEKFTGSRSYRYNKNDAKARLMEEGYELSDINKYTLEQQRIALFNIEHEPKRKKQKEEKDKVDRSKVIQRPKLNMRTGGTIQRFSVGGFIQKFQYGSSMPGLTSETTTTKETVADIQKKKVAAQLIERNKATTAYNVKIAAQNKLTTAKNKIWYDNKIAKIAKDLNDQLEKNKMTNADIKDQDSEGNVTNVDDEKAKAEAAAKVAEVEAQYNKAKDTIAKTPEKAKWSANLNEVTALVGNLRPSDFFGKFRIRTETPFREDVSAPAFIGNTTENMPGLERAMDATYKGNRYVDSADSFLVEASNQAQEAEAGRQRGELIARNAQFVSGQKAEQVANTNRNTEAAINANNINIQAANATRSNEAAQRVQALVARDTFKSKQSGQIINTLTKGAIDAFKVNRTESITKKYNAAADLKGKWNTEYLPKYNAAIAANDAAKVKEIKTSFINEHQYDPDELDKQMMDYKTQFRALGS